MLKRSPQKHIAKYLWFLAPLFWAAALGSPIAIAGGTTTVVSLADDLDFRVALRPYARVFLDYAGQMTVGELAHEQTIGIPIERQYIDYGLREARIWLRTKLHNPTSDDGVWRLDLRRQFVKSLNVFLVAQEQSPRLLLSHTHNDSFDARPIPNRHLSVDVPVRSQETVEVIVAYQSDASTWLPYTISTREAYAVAHARENSYNWLINGALISVLAVALILAPVVSWRISTAFCAYIISGTLFVLNSEGYAFQYLWPNQPWLNDPIDLVFILMMSASGPAFSRLFFDVEKHSTLLNRLLIALISLSFAFALVTFPMFRFDAFKLIAYPLVVASSLLHLAVATLACRRKLTGAIPILVGATCVVGSMLYASLAHAIPGRISLERTLDVGHLTLLIEAVAFAAAIAVRLSRVRADRDRALLAELRAAQEKIALNKELSQSQARYDSARRQALRRREELSSIQHDIAQPLSSLRAAMADLENIDLATSESMYTAFDYLESIALAGKSASGARSPIAETDDVIEVFKLGAILDNVVAIFSTEANKKGLKLRYRALDCEVRTIPLEFMRAVSNLVSNAVKYTNKGGVLLAARRRAGRVEVSVWDTGPGMNELTLELAITEHQRGKGSTGRGLGLHLVTETAEKLDLAFSIESKLSSGTTARIYVDEVPKRDE